MEQWKTIETFDNYEVSDEGRIRNVSTGRVIRQQKHPRTGLPMVPIYRGGKQYTRNVHRLVAEAFLDEPPENCVPIHIDGDRSNCHADNLEWRSLSYARELTQERGRTTPMDPRPVRHIELNLEFPNALEAARAMDGFERYVLYAARVGNTTYKRGHWEFIG